MPRLRRSKKSEPFRPQHPTLPILSDAQTDEIEKKARLYRIDLNRCPTCGAGHEEPVPGVDLGWRLDSTYHYLGSEHPCDCAWQDELRRRYLLADIPRQYWTYGIEDYYGDPGAWDVAEAYLSNWLGYRDSGLGLEFHSITMGTGKTFLLTHVARQLIQAEEDVYYRPFRDIMGLYQGDNQAVKDRLQYCTVLALDEVGKALSGPQGEYFAMEFENLIRDRIDSNRVTLMTTNLTPRQLDEHYPRTYSLLSVKQQRYAIDGIDVRREGHQDIERTLAESGEVRPIR